MKKLVLIVEDDQLIAETVSEFLEMEGYAAVRAENGEVALAVLKTISLPSVILLDMSMPVMDGWVFAVAFHAVYDGAAPLIVMTAAADAAERARAVGAEAWIGKPFNPDDLLALIKKHERA